MSTKRLQNLRTKGPAKLLKDFPKCCRCGFSFLQPFQPNPTPRPPRPRPGSTPRTRQAVQVRPRQPDRGAQRRRSPGPPRPAGPAGPSAPPSHPRRLPGDALGARGWARPGRLPPPDPGPHPSAAERPGLPPAPARPRGDSRRRPLRSHRRKTTRRLKRAQTRQPQQPSWHIRLRSPRPPRRRRVRPRRQRAPRPLAPPLANAPPPGPPATGSSPPRPWPRPTLASSPSSPRRPRPSPTCPAGRTSSALGGRPTYASPFSRSLLVLGCETSRGFSRRPMGRISLERPRPAGAPAGIGGYWLSREAQWRPGAGALLPFCRWPPEARETGGRVPRLRRALLRRASARARRAAACGLPGYGHLRLGVPVPPGKLVSVNA